MGQMKSASLHHFSGTKYIHKTHKRRLRYVAEQTIKCNTKISLTSFGWCNFTVQRWMVVVEGGRCLSHGCINGPCLIFAPMCLNLTILHRQPPCCQNQGTRGRSPSDKLPPPSSPPPPPPSPCHIVQHGCLHGEDLLLRIATWILYSSKENESSPHTQI